MARGSNSNQHQSYDRYQHHVSSERGGNHMSSQRNRHPVYTDRINVPTHTDHDLVAQMPNALDIFPPGQHTELIISRAPLPEMESFPYYSRDRDSNWAYTVSNRDVEVSQQQIWPGRAADEVISLTSTKQQTTHYGCYSIPTSRAMASPIGRCLPTLHEHEESFLHEQSNAFPSCLYPKHVKIKLNVKPVEKPPELMDAGEIVRPRNVRVSLMASSDSPEQISFKLLHGDEPEVEPEPENIEMPVELMPSPPPPEEVVEVKLLPVGDSHLEHAKGHCRTGLAVSSIVMRTLGIGAYVGLEMAHQFAVYSFRVLNNGFHVYGPVVAKAAFSSYKGLRRGCKVFLHKSAPIANHAKNVTLACIRKRGEGCVQEMKKQNFACIACFSVEDDSEDEMDNFEEFKQLGSNRPSHYDLGLAWKESLRKYPEAKEEPEPEPDSEVNCCGREEPVDREEPVESMGHENPQDRPTPELSVLEDYPYYLHKGDTSPHNTRKRYRLRARNFDNMSSIVPFNVAISGYYGDSASRCRKRLSLSHVRNKPRRNHKGHGLGALVWPPPDIRRFSDPLRDHELAVRLAVRPEPKHYRDLLQQPPLEGEAIWRNTLRAYFKEERAQVRPEDVLLCRQAVHMKLLSREEFERNEEEHIVSDRCAKYPCLEGYAYYSENRQMGEFFPLSDSRRPSHDLTKRLKQPPLLHISHGDRIVHHCATKRKPLLQKVLPNRGKDKKQLGHSSLPHLRHDEFGSVAKSHDHNEKLMRNEESHGVSSIHSRMEDGDFWQPNPIHSSESEWKVLPASQASHHRKKRPHSPDSMEEVPHSPVFQAVEKSDNSDSQAHPHGKHQKLEVLSAPDSLIQAKFSKRPLRISKHKLSSDRSKVGSPAESGQSRRPLKSKSPRSPQATPSKEKPPFYIPKISQSPRKTSPHSRQSTPSKGRPPFQTSRKSFADRDAHSVHIPSDKHLQSLPSSPLKSFNHLIPYPFPRGRKALSIFAKGYRRIHPHPSERYQERTWRTPRKGDGGLGHSSSIFQPSAKDLERKGRFSKKRETLSRSPARSYPPDLYSKWKSWLKDGLSCLRRPSSLSSQVPQRQPAKEDDKVDPSKRSSFWNLTLKGKLRFSIFKQSQPALKPNSPGTPPKKKIHHSIVGEIPHGKKRDQGHSPLQSQDQRKLAKRQPLNENVPRLKIFLSKKDPHGMRSCFQRPSQQHGRLPIKTVFRIKSTPKKALSSTSGNKRTKSRKVKADTKLKILKKDAPQVPPLSCVSFPYPIRTAARRKHTDRNVSGRSSPQKPTAKSRTPSRGGKRSNLLNTQGAMARSGSSRWTDTADHLPASPSSSKLRRQPQFRVENPVKAHLHRRDPNVSSGDNLWSSKYLTPEITQLLQPGYIKGDGNKPSQPPKKHEGQTFDTDSEGTSKPDDGKAFLRDYAENLASPARAVSPVQDEIKFLRVDSIDVKFASKTDDTSKRAALQETLIDIGTIAHRSVDSDQFLDKHDRGKIKDNSTDMSGQFESSGNFRLLDSSEPSHHEGPTVSTVKAVLLPNNVVLPGSDEDGDDSSSDIPYQRNPEISKLLTAYKEALLKEIESPYTGILESEPVPDSGIRLQSSTDAAQPSYQHSSRFDNQKLPPPSEFFQDVENHTPESSSRETSSNFDAASETSLALPKLAESSEEGVGSFEHHDQQKSYVDRTGEGEGDIALESHQSKLPAQLDKPERPEDETHYFSPAVIHSSPAEGEISPESHPRLHAQFDKHHERPEDETHVFSPVVMHSSPAEGDVSAESHQPKLHAQFDKHERPEDETQVVSHVVMHSSPAEGDVSPESHQSKLHAQFDKHERPEDETQVVSHVVMYSSPAEGDVSPDSHQSKLHAQFVKHERHEDETHVFSRVVMLHSSPAEGEIAPESQRSKPHAQFDKPERPADETYVFLPVVMHSSPAEGDLAPESHPSKPHAQFDKHERPEDETHVLSHVLMHSSPAEGDVSPESHRSKPHAQFDNHERPKDETQVSSHVVMHSFPADDSFDSSGQSTKDGGSSHTLDRAKHVYGEQDLGHMEDDQGEKSLASLEVNQPLSQPTDSVQLLEQTPRSEEVSNPRVFDVEIVQVEEIIYDGDEDQEEALIRSEIQKEPRQLDAIGHVEKVESLHRQERGSNTSEEDSLASESLHIRKLVGKGQDVLHMEELDNQISLTSSHSVKGHHVTDEHKGESQQDGKYSSSVSSQILLGEVLIHDERFSQEKDGRQFESNLERTLVEDYSEIGEHEHESSVSSHSMNLRGFTQEGFGIENDKENVDISSHNMTHRRFKQEGFAVDSEEEKVHIHHPELEPYIFGDEEKDTQSFVSSGSQTSRTGNDKIARSAVIDQNFSQFKFSEKLAAWETLARGYEPPAKQKGPSDDMTTFVTMASKQDQSSSKSREVRGLDLAISSRQLFTGDQSATISQEGLSSSSSHEGHRRRDDHDYAEGLPAVNATSITIDRGVPHSTFHRQEEIASDNQENVEIQQVKEDSQLGSPSSRSPDLNQVDSEIFQGNSIIDGDKQRKEKRNAWEVISSVKEELYCDPRSEAPKLNWDLEDDDDGNFDLESDFGDLEETADGRVFSLKSEISVSAQSLSESYETASEQAFATSSDSEAGLRRSRSFEGSESRTPSPSPLKLQTSDGKNFVTPARSRKSVFVRPDLKKSLIRTSGNEQTFAALQQSAETEQTISRSRSDQREVEQQLSSGNLDTSRSELRSDTKDDERETGYQSESVLDGSRLESRSPSPSSSQGSDGDLISPARSRKRKSLFTRPLLKNSLVATSETEKIFSRLQSEQNDTSSEQLFDTVREGGGVGRFASSEGLTGSRPSAAASDSPGSNRSSMLARSRKSLLTRPVLKESLVANSETERIFAQLQSEQNEAEQRRSRTEDTISEQLFDTREGGGVGRSASFEGLTGSRPSAAASDSQGSNRVSMLSRSRKSLLTRPVLKESLVANSETEKIFAQLQFEQNEAEQRRARTEDTNSEQQFDTRERGPSVGRSASFEGLRGFRPSGSAGDSQGSDSSRKSIFTRPVLKKSLVANSETGQVFAQLQSEQNEVEELLSRPGLLSLVDNAGRSSPSSLDGTASEPDGAGFSGSSYFQAGLESGASSQLSEGTTIFSPGRSDESEGRSSPRPRPRIRSALKRSLSENSDTEESFAEQALRKRVKFDDASPEDTSDDTGAKSIDSAQDL